jgi:drug/metabolite transporter (DMT)-like permease
MIPRSPTLTLHPPRRPTAPAAGPALVDGYDIPAAQRYSPWIFAIPACLDLLASTLMAFGLMLTYASTFQMLRGSVVFFTSILSYLFLKRSLRAHQWTGLIALIIGLVLVGASSQLQQNGSAPTPHASSPMLGNTLVVIAQMVVAVQMVVEEHYLGKYTVHPMLAVGWEGVFGLAFSGGLLLVTYHIPGWSNGGRLEDTPDALAQIGHSAIIAVCFFGSIALVAFFNFFGMQITKQLSATTRTMVDSVRTFVVWAVALSAQWERFQWLQPVGFVLLLLGFFAYYGTIPVPGCPVEPAKPAPRTARGDGDGDDEDGEERESLTRSYGDREL